MMTLFHVTIDTPLGYMRPVSDGTCLIRLDWDQSRFSAPDNPDDVSRETLKIRCDGDAVSFELFVFFDLFCELREPWVVDPVIPNDIVVFFLSGLARGYDVDEVFFFINEYH